MDVKIVNKYTSVFTTIGWLVSVSYYTWLSGNAEHVSLIKIIALFTLGAIIVCRLIYATMTTIAAAITYKLTGDIEGSSDIFAVATFLSPILSFFAGKYAVLLLAK